MLAMDEHVQTMNIEERIVVAKPTEVLEDILLGEGNPKKFTKIGTRMEEKTKQDLVQFLRKSIDVFTWSHEDMPGIDQGSLLIVRMCIYLPSPFVKRRESLLLNEIMLLRKRSRS